MDRNIIFQNNKVYIDILTVMKLGQTGIKFNFDSISRNQIASKLWIINTLSLFKIDFGTVFFCAGWYAILALMMFEKGFAINKIRSFDIDPEVEQIADIINHPYVINEWRFKAVTGDIHNINYDKHSYQVFSESENANVKLVDKPDTIINTSCEHMENFSEWYDKIPTGKILILQSNDFEIDEHINRVRSIDEFADQTPLSEILFSGQNTLSMYTRFMRIGIK